MSFLEELFGNGFMPHGACYLWRPGLLSMHVGSDLLIALSYFSIPVFLFYLLRRRPALELGWALWLFGSFILLCGVTHVFGIWTVWDPRYYLEGGIKTVTAVVSALTAASLWIKLDAFLAIPSPAELAQKNEQLEREIRQRAKAEAELRRSNLELESFAYVASHDLQEPLRVVGGYTRLLAKRYKGRLDSDADEFIAYAEDGVARMQGMISDLLELSRIGTGEIEKAPVYTEKVMEEVEATLAAPIESTGASIGYGSLPTVEGDAMQISRLFGNLVGNAIKFHRPGEPPKVDISARRGDGEWLFSIADNGIGIAPEDAEEVFEIFRRLNSSAEYEGTGIGLTVCRRIVERHGGRLWFESEPGEGAVFHFTLPAVEEEDATKAGGGAAAGDAGAPPAGELQPEARG